MCKLLGLILDNGIRSPRGISATVVYFLSTWMKNSICMHIIWLSSFFSPHIGLGLVIAFVVWCQNRGDRYFVFVPTDNYCNCTLFSTHVVSIKWQQLPYFILTGQEAYTTCAVCLFTLSEIQTDADIRVSTAKFLDTTNIYQSHMQQSELFRWSGLCTSPCL